MSFKTITKYNKTNIKVNKDNILTIKSIDYLGIIRTLKN